MIDKQQDFLTLTGAARRARAKGYDITYHSLRNPITPRHITHAQNGAPPLLLFFLCLYILSRRGSRLNRAWITSSPAPATNPTVCSRRHLDAGGIFEASSKQ